MNKRHVLLLTAVLGMASAQAQTAPATNQTAIQKAARDASLSSAPVSVNTGIFRGPLSVLLSAVAKSAGYEVVYNFNVDALALIDGNLTDTGTTASAGSPASASTSYASALGKPQELSAKPIAYNFIQRPFNEVWPLLMDVYELQYEVLELGSGKIIRISQRPAQATIKLNNLVASVAIARMKEFFGSEKLDKDGNPTGIFIFDSKTMKAVSGSQSNELVLGGTAEEIRKMIAFVSDMDGQSKPTTVSPQIQVIYSVKSNLTDVQSLIRNEYPDLKVSALPQTNQLVLSGPQDKVTAAQALLAKADTVVPGAAASVPTTQKVYTILGNQEDTVKFLTSQYPSLKILPVGQTGQLVLSGDEAQINSAVALLSQVDKAAVPANATVQKVFQLINASAEEVKATLEGTLARDLTNQPDLANATLLDPVTGQPYSGSLANAPMNQQNGQTTVVTAPATTTAVAAQNPVTVIADKRTNTLIVRGTQVQVDQVSDLIPQLDRVVPQINVQVRIQEITQKATRALGLNWNVNFGGFQVKAADSGLSASFDPTRSLVGFNIFPTLTALESQNLSKKVYDGNISMQSGQRSFGNFTATQNSSSTAAATIKSGSRLEINIPSAAANVPAIQKQIDYGVNLDFYDPQVSPDGTITLRIRGQINDLVTTIPDNAATIPNLLKFTNSEAQSTITFKSGQTMLLSGLMGSKNTDTKQGVPYLSLIPGVGAAFGKQSYENTATQLLVVITGTVVK